MKPWLKAAAAPAPTTPPTPVTPTTPTTTSPANPQPEGKKIWAISEVNKMSNARAMEYASELQAALIEGRIDMTK